VGYQVKFREGKLKDITKKCTKSKQNKDLKKTGENKCMTFKNISKGILLINMRTIET